MSIFFRKKKLKLLDFLIILLFLSVFFTFFVMITEKKDSPIVKISSPEGNFEYSLLQDRNVNIKGIAGITEVCIENKSVFIKNSICKNKTCILSGKIYKSGQWLCCAPNEVFVIITSSQNNSEEIDAVSF